jgi:tRNA (mo5U34)-methyltransferase
MTIVTNFERVIQVAQKTAADIDVIKAKHLDLPWYPYDSMGNFQNLKPLLSSVDYLFKGPKRIADIGAADGHLAFAFERAGSACDIYDNGPTNYNNLRGARLLRRELRSKIGIFEQDLDSQFNLNGHYDLAIFLGIFYHLKNPYYALETIGRHTDHMIFSTRVCRHYRYGSADISDAALAYLLGPVEANNDATNYWIFTVEGLMRIFERTGWRLVAGYTVGDTAASNPQDQNADERFMGVLTRT